MVLSTVAAIPLGLRLLTSSHQSAVKAALLHHYYSSIRIRRGSGGGSAACFLPPAESGCPSGSAGVNYRRWISVAINMTN